MKTTTAALVLVVVIAAFAAAMFFRAGSTNEPAQPPQVSGSERASEPKVKPGSASAPLHSRPQGSPNLPAGKVAQDGSPISTTLAGPGESIEKRLIALEATVEALKQAMAGVSIEKASADRQALFAAEEGYLKADEYAAAGQHAIAGEGYLTFLQHHPDHPDAREVMKKARDEFLKAGYKDKAFWVHEEMMKANPHHQAGDLWEQATLEKDAGLYNNAVNHAAQAAEMATNPEDRLWKRLYWAWYVQLRDGTPAGIAALTEVQREIQASGVSNPKLMERVNQRMQEWQRQASSR